MYKYSFLGFSWDFNANDHFMNSFVVNDEYTSDYNNCDYVFIGCFTNEEQYNIIKDITCIKILYITEPIEYTCPFAHRLYTENKIDILFGSVDNDKEKMFKKPFWYNENINDVYFFDNINKYVANCENILDKRFCSLVNRHDNGSTRTHMYNKLKEYSFIECPSSLLNNCSNTEINSIGNNEYFKLFKFNICSENYLTTIPGYFTEKMWNCCLGGAIPIYCGFFGEIEEKTFNKDRILFYNPHDEESMENVKQKVEFLLNNPEKMIEFYKQPVFKDTAFEASRTYNVNVYYMMKSIYKKIEANK